MSGAGLAVKVDTTASEADSGGRRHRRFASAAGAPEGAAETKAVVLSFDCFKEQRHQHHHDRQAFGRADAEARLTLDAGKPRRIPGFAGTTPSGGQLVLTIPQDSMLALLGRHQHASVEYVDGAGSSKTVAEFPLAGLEEYRSQFRAACAKAGAR